MVLLFASTFIRYYRLTSPLYSKIGWLIRLNKELKNQQNCIDRDILFYYWIIYLSTSCTYFICVWTCIHTLTNALTTRTRPHTTIKKKTIDAVILHCFTLYSVSSNFSLAIDLRPYTYIYIYIYYYSNQTQAIFHTWWAVPHYLRGKLV